MCVWVTSKRTAESDVRLETSGLTRSTETVPPVWRCQVSLALSPAARLCRRLMQLCLARQATIDATAVTSHLRGHRTTNSITSLSTFRRFRPHKQSNIDVLIQWFNLLVYRYLRWPIMTDMSTAGRDCTEWTAGDCGDVSCLWTRHWRSKWPTLEAMEASSMWTLRSNAVSAIWKF